MPENNFNIIGLLRASFWSPGKLLSDLLGIGAMADMVSKSLRKTAIKIRKAAFEKLLAEKANYLWADESIIIMNGAKPNGTELQTAQKLAKTEDYFLVFPNDGQIQEVRLLLKDSGEKRNDVYLIDRTTYKAIAADIKTCGNPSVETIAAHLSGGVNQAPNLILDITGKISKAKLIKGLRAGWSKRLRFLYLNYHGRWYLLDKAKVFDNSWLTKTLR